MKEGISRNEKEHLGRVKRKGKEREGEKVN